MPWSHFAEIGILLPTISSRGKTCEDSRAEPFFRSCESVIELVTRAVNLLLGCYTTLCSFFGSTFSF